MKLPFLRKQNANSEWTPRRRLADPEPTIRESATVHDVNSYSTYRRNQTITGSKSQFVASANEHDAQLQSPRAKVHALKKKRRSIAKRLFTLALSGAVIVFVLTQLMAKVDVSLYGQVGAMRPADQQRYANLLYDYFGQHPLERFRLFFDATNASQFMQQQGAAEVKEIVSVKSGDFGSAAIVVKPREPVASWTIQSTQYFVDMDGIIFSQSYFNSPAVKIVDESGLVQDVKSQKAVTSQRFLQFVGKGVALFSRSNVAVESVVIPANTSRQVDFLVSGGPRLKLTIDRSVGEQVEDGVRSLQYLADKAIGAGYIDIRVSRKAFYQ